MHRTAIAVTFASLSVLACGVTFAVVDHGSDTGQETDVLGVIFILPIVAFVAVGGLLIARRPANIIGALLAGNGALYCIGVAADGYARHALYADRGSLPFGSAAAWISTFTIDGPAIAFGFFVFLFLLFPDGRVESRVWRRLLVVLIAALVALQAITMLAPGELSAYPGIENPFAIAFVGRVAGLEAPVFLVLVATVVASLVSLIRRYRGARGAQREQLKWVVYACAFVGTVIGSAPLLWSGIFDGARTTYAWPVLFACALSSVPVACGFAILRYRLYDIDRVVSRTLTYAMLTVGLAGVYAALVVGVQPELRGIGGGSDLASVITTLAVAALFLPARRRVQTLVDRRFNRHNYDAARTVEAFSLRLRDEIDLDTLRGALGSVLSETMQPAHASLWLRGSRDAISGSDLGAV